MSALQYAISEALALVRSSFRCRLHEPKGYVLEIGALRISRGLVDGLQHLVEWSLSNEAAQARSLPTPSRFCRKRDP